MHVCCQVNVRTITDCMAGAAGASERHCQRVWANERRVCHTRLMIKSVESTGGCSADWSLSDCDARDFGRSDIGVAWWWRRVCNPFVEALRHANTHPNTRITILRLCPG